MENGINLDNDFPTPETKVGCQAFCASKDCYSIGLRGASCRNFENANQNEIKRILDQHEAGIQDFFENNYM